MNELHIAPNRPVFVALVDPEGIYDADLNRGTYQTTDGQTLILPRPAVIALNMYGPAKGEEIEITQSYSGHAKDRPEWSIRSAAEATKEAAAREEARSTPEPVPEPINAPTPIRGRRRPDPGPGLFDMRGTGTYGPMPAAQAYAAPKLVNRRPPSPPQIPANIAFREVSAWVAAELQANNLQWTDKAQQAVVSTVFIAEYKAGRIGPWEREK